MKKKVASVHTAHAPHMVGDGLPVRNLFSYNDLGRKELSPFLMLDLGVPTEYPPTEERLGVGMHPHRGFETVTIAFKGGIEHRDTGGNHGEIGPGDVQWMTAGSGVLHEELHSESFRKNGGTLHMAQLWVNLPKEHKMTAPKYQTLLNREIPVVSLSEGKGKLRVISGNYKSERGPADTFTPINLWEVEVSEAAVELEVPAEYTTAIVVLEGNVSVNGTHKAGASSLVVLDKQGTAFTVESSERAHFLVLNGKPIEESVFGYGPFVMNTKEEIVEALNDYNAGRFAAAKR